MMTYEFKTQQLSEYLGCLFKVLKTFYFQKTKLLVCFKYGPAIQNALIYLFQLHIDANEKR